MAWSPVSAAMGVHVVDLRGRTAGASAHSVLADPTGRRRRQLTRLGRGVACLLAVWLCGLGLAGVGLLPGRLGSWALLVGSPSSPPRIERLEHPKAVPTQATGRVGVGAASESRVRQRATSTSGFRGGAGQLSHARGQSGLRPVKHAQAAPRRHRSLIVRAAAPARSEAGGPSSSSTQGGATGQSPGVGEARVAGQSRTERAREVPGRRAELAPGWGVATSATQTTTTPSSNSSGHAASTPEHPEGHGHETATLTSP